MLEEWVNATDPDNNITFNYARAEELRGEFDLITSRAFIPYPYSAEVICRLVKNDGYYAPFGANLTDPPGELTHIDKAGFRKIKTLLLKNLDFLGSRHIKLLKKIKQPVQNFPRPWKIITKEIKEVNG